MSAESQLLSLILIELKKQNATLEKLEKRTHPTPPHEPHAEEAAAAPETKKPRARAKKR